MFLICLPGLLAAAYLCAAPACLLSAAERTGRAAGPRDDAARVDSTLLRINGILEEELDILASDPSGAAGGTDHARFPSQESAEWKPLPSPGDEVAKATESCKKDDNCACSKCFGTMCFCYARGEGGAPKCPSEKGRFCSTNDNHFHYVVNTKNTKIPVTPTTLQFKCNSTNGDGKAVYWLSRGLHRTFHDRDDQKGKAGETVTDEECFKQYGNLGTGSPFSGGSEVGSGGLFWQTRDIANKIAYFPQT